jgi:hypothetical protein
LFNVAAAISVMACREGGRVGDFEGRDVMVEMRI